MRVIDRKYHIEGEQIIKSTNGVAIPEGEPLILFRGRDRLALPMLRAYREICVQDGCTQYHIDALDQVIADFEAFAVGSPQAMKQPGCTLGR